jgi:hypothetical protein
MNKKNQSLTPTKPTSHDKKDFKQENPPNNIKMDPIKENGVNGIVAAEPTGTSSESSKEAGTRPYLPKTGIARLTYNLSELPSLHIFSINVEYGSRKQVQSRKLRYLAVEEFLRLIEEELKVDGIRKCIAIKVDWMQGPFDPVQDTDRFARLIVPGIKDPSLEKIVQKLNTRVEIPLRDTKYVVKQGEKMKVTCKVIGSGKEISSGDESYHQDFDLLLSSIGNSKLDRTKERSLYGTGKGFAESLPNKYDDTLQRLPGTPHPNMALEKASTVGIKINYLPQLEKRDPSKIHVNVSLLPYIKEKCVADVLFELLGYDILGPSIHKHLESIRRVLVGLHVECVYRMDKDENGRSYSMKPSNDVAMFLGVPPSPKQQWGRRSVIKEVKLHSEVGTFVKRGSDGQEQRYSVTKYFNEMILGKKGPLKYVTLPLANIGDVKAGRQIWVPLEMLEVDHEQLLRHSRHFTEELQAERDAFLGNQENVDKMLKKASQYMDFI